MDDVLDALKSRIELMPARKIREIVSRRRTGVDISVVCAALKRLESKGLANSSKGEDGTLLWSFIWEATKDID
jgi:DNA-binding MarR family transcriptional regulator